MKNPEYLSGERLLGVFDLKTMPRSYHSTGSILGDLLDVQYTQQELMNITKEYKITGLTKGELDTGYTAVNFLGRSNSSETDLRSVKKIKSDNK